MVWDLPRPGPVTAALGGTAAGSGGTTEHAQEPHEIHVLKSTAFRESDVTISDGVSTVTVPLDDKPNIPPQGSTVNWCPCILPNTVVPLGISGLAQS